MPPPTDLLQGTLDLLILKMLALVAMHGWGIAQRIQQVSNNALQGRPGLSVLALHRLECMGLDPLRLGQFREQPPRKVLLSTQQARSG